MVVARLDVSSHANVSANAGRCPEQKVREHEREGPAASPADASISQWVLDRCTLERRPLTRSGRMVDRSSSGERETLHRLTITGAAHFLAT
jgi:hypothetical protein